MAIQINQKIWLDEGELSFKTLRASGPGGQNVNRVASAVQLRFDIRNSPSLPEDVRRRALKLGGRRVTDAGTIIIEASRFRTQERNRQDALNRLIELLKQAARRPKPRRRTRPSAKAKRKRLEAKRRRGEIKRLRRRVRYPEL